MGSTTAPRTEGDRRVTAIPMAVTAGRPYRQPVHILVTGGSGVLGRMSTPIMRERGHELLTPSSAELDLFDPAQVGAAVDDVEAVLHLASRIPPHDRMRTPGAWDVNDRLRDVATRLIVDAALAGTTTLVVVPTVAFVYPPGPADESTSVVDVPYFLRSALTAERHLRGFTEAGRRGVALRLGSLYGPGAATSTPSTRYDAHLETRDAGEAIAAALICPGGVYNVVEDADPVSHDHFTRATGWRPRR